MKIQNNQMPFLFSGKFGDVVGRVVNGRQVISKKRAPRKGKPSLRELEIRRNMAIATRFLKPIAPLLKQKYNKPDGNMGYHQAISFILRNAIVGQHPDRRINYSQVIFGNGNLPDPEDYHVDSPTKGLLVFGWH